MYNNKKASSLPLKFKHFTRKSYALFACLCKEVVIGTLSASTLTYAKAEGVSTKPVKADTTVMHREVESGKCYTLTYYYDTESNSGGIDIEIKDDMDTEDVERPI